MNRADELLNELGTTMAQAVDLVRATLKPNAPVRVTVFVRSLNDAQAHAFVGNDTVEGAMQGLAELGGDPGSKMRHVTAHGVLP